MGLYFIDPVNGNDDRSGSESRPWLTLRKANATLQPGDTLVLRGGTHRMFRTGSANVNTGAIADYFNWSACGETVDGIANPLKIMAYPGETPIWDACILPTWTKVGDYWRTPATEGMIGSGAYAWWGFKQHGFSPVPIRSDGIVVNGTIAPGGLNSGGLTTPIGRFSDSNLHNGKRVYWRRDNQTQSPAYQLFYTGTYWVLASTLTDTPTNYWRAPDAGGDTPPTGVDFLPFGSCTGNVQLTSIDTGDFPADFVAPPNYHNTYAELQFYSASGVLQFDLLHHDITTGYLWLRTNDVEPYDPNGVMYLRDGDYTSHVGINSHLAGHDLTDIEFDGIEFGPGTYLQVPSYGSPLYYAKRITVSDCRFNAVAIQGVADNLTFEKNVVDFVDDMVVAYRTDGSYSPGWHTHDAYIAGANLVIRNNALLRSRSGKSLSIYGPSSPSPQVYGNVMYSRIGVYAYATSPTFYGNICIIKPAILFGETYFENYNSTNWMASASSPLIRDNYFEFNGDSNYAPFDLAGNTLCDIQGNTIAIDGACTSFMIDSVGDSTFTSIADNTFLAPTSRGASLSGKVTSTTWDDFGTWLTGQGYLGNTFALDSTFLDPIATEAFLDTVPSYDAVMAYFRTYAATKMVLAHVLGSETITIAGPANLYMVGDSGSVEIGGVVVDVMLDGGVVTWDDSTLTEGTATAFRAANTEYTVTHLSTDASGHATLAVAMDAEDTHSLTGLTNAQIAKLAIGYLQANTAMAIADAVLDEAKGTHTGHLAQIPANPYTGTPPTPNEIATELLDLANGVENGVTPRQTLRIMAAVLAGKVSGAGSGEESFTGLDGSTPRVEVTVDPAGNRTNVNYTPN